MTNFYPDYFYEYLKDFFLLLCALISYKGINYIPETLKKKFNASFLKGFVYGMLFFLGYLAITCYSKPIGFMWFSFGVGGITLFFYVCLIVFLFWYISGYIGPVQGIIASLFTVYWVSIVWEIPTFFLVWKSLNEWTFSQTILASLLLPAFYVFDVKIRRFIYFMPFFGFNILSTLLMGNPSIHIPLKLTPVEPVWMLSRLICFTGIFVVMWYHVGEKYELEDMSK